MMKTEVVKIALLLCGLAVLANGRSSGLRAGDGGEDIESLELRFPDRDIAEANTYQYVNIPIDHDAFTITGLQPDPTHPAKTHHMTLFLCTGTQETYNTVTSITSMMRKTGLMMEPDCQDKTILGGFDNMDGTAKPEALTFPMGFGKTVGNKFKFNYALLEIHYNAPVTDDSSGFILEGVEGKDDLAGDGATTLKQISAFMLSPKYFELSPHDKNAAVDFKATAVTPFRVLMAHYHFHSRGTDIHLKITSPDMATTYLNQTYTREVNTTNSAIYDGSLLIPTGAAMTVQCVYDTTAEDNAIKAGFDSTEEMCDVFIFGAVDKPCDAQVDTCAIAVRRDVMVSNVPF